MNDVKLNGMRELNFNEIEEVSGGWIFVPWVVKTIGWGLVGVLGANAISGSGDGPRGPTPAGPPVRR